MDKTRQSVLIAVAAVVVVALAGWYLLISPERSHAASLRSQATQATQQTQTLQAQLAMRRAQEKQLPAKEALLAQLQSRIPADPELPSLIRQLSAAADSAGVTLVSMSPSAPTAAATAAPAPAPARPSTPAKPGAAPAAPAAPAPTLDQISLSLNVVGGYFNLEQFFANLENLPRALRVTGFNLSGFKVKTPSTGKAPSTAPVNPTTAGPGQMTASITALVFMSPSATASAAPAATH